ncbi:hypothetical protein BJ165DRAFT_422639 [Panaeolus papilionaceus]|nr:hypothetical protein BJ165DRAFT_422639 [Panaeolus papilionaceus]
MLSPKITLFHVLFFLLAHSSLQIYGRENVLERDGRPIFFSRRRLGQGQPTLMKRLSEACLDEICGKLAGDAVFPLLATQPECSQQDMADDIIDASRQFDSNTQAEMIAVAIEYRQLEKNTPTDNSWNPPKLLNSVYCQKASRNAELYGLVQSQDPANDPDLFYDPALKATVVKGSQRNTSPFQQLGGRQLAPSKTISPYIKGSKTQDVLAEESRNCPRAITVKVVGTPIPIPSGAVVVTFGRRASSTTPVATPTVSPLPTGASFGSCSIPEIEFGAGYDNRRETSFRPADQVSFDQASAPNITLITEFICNALTNTCNANQAARDLCTEASRASLVPPSGTGAQADAFNAVFGESTNFANVVPLDTQGNPLTSGISSAGPIPPITFVASPTPTSSSSAVPVGNGGAGDGGGTSDGGAGTNTGNSGGNTNTGGNNNGGNNNNGNNAIGNFGTCPTPRIDFGVFNGQRQTSFSPEAGIAFGQGPSTNINVIANAMCDRVGDSCRADATAIATCDRAKAAAASSPNGTGAAADAFNAVFGITTNFASVQALDNQGRPITDTGSEPPPSNNNGNNNGSNRNVSNPNGNTSNVVGNNTGGSGGNNSSNLQTFTGSLGNVAAPAVTSIGNGQFQVQGNTFNAQKDAVVRSCNLQKNQCSDAANASGNQNGFTVAACTTQENQCIAQAG